MLMERYGSQLGNVCIVVPNRRAGLFIRNIIGQAATTPVWAPDIFAQDDFMAKLSGLTVADKLTQLFYFYEVYKDLEGEDARSFADFIHWAPSLLADFNEIDQYMADTHQLFTYLNEAKAIDMWNLGRTELTDFQKRYLHFWNKLQDFYKALNAKLSTDGLAYQGMAYRKAVEHVAIPKATAQWERIFFLGFNALTVAEEQVMKHLVADAKAEIYWDADHFYVDNDAHEAGKFLRKYRGFFGDNFEWIGDYLRDTNKEIEIIGVSGNVAQAKYAGKLIDDLAVANNGNVDGTALVLADESLLLPVLNALPPAVETINVTMGYPLKYTPVASFIDAVFSLTINSLKFSEGRSEQRYYFKDVITLTGHPLFILLSGGKPEATTIQYEISSHNYVFLNKKLLGELLGEDLVEKLLFRKKEEGENLPLQFAIYLDGIVTLLKDKIVAEADSTPASDLKLEYLFTYHKYLQKLQGLISNQSPVGDLQTLRLLFNQLISTSTLPFYGEPLNGLQIMGMLETRTLDFDNVVMLSVNEGVLPQGKAGHSFIPADVKRNFELPTYTDKDAIFAYHFYRLLQRAKKVWLLYTTQSDGGIGSKERSRFITQIVNELKGPKINEKLLDIPMAAAVENEITIQKSEAVIAKLLEQGVTGFSPSALTMFLTCPLQFYFRHIAGLKESDTVKETIEANKLGDMVHKTLEELFKPFIGVELKAEHVETMQLRASTLMEGIFEAEFGRDNYLYGKNLLIYRVSKKFVDNFLHFQKEFVVSETGKGLPITVTGLEIPLLAPITINNHTVNIRGNADRIEESGNRLRIIDYKTGAIDAYELKFNEWDDLLNNLDKAKSIQLLTYAWLYKQMAPETGTIIPAILAFTKLSNGLMACQTPGGNGTISDKDFTNFEGVLKTVLDNLFDTSQPFNQTPEKTSCRYCPYNGICNRN